MSRFGGNGEKRCKACRQFKYRDEFRTNNYGYPASNCKTCETEIAAERKREKADARAIDRVIGLVEPEDADLARQLRALFNWPSIEVKAAKAQEDAHLTDEGLIDLGNLV